MADQKKKRIVLDIGGMHCATCVQTIEKRLPKVKGVIYATINLAAEKAIIDYDPTVVDQQTIEDAITDVGYKVIHQEVTLKLSGMHCTMCAQAIEKGSWLTVQAFINAMNDPRITGHALQERRPFLYIETKIQNEG